MFGGWFPLPSSTCNLTYNACLMPHILMGYFIHRHLFHRPWYIIEPSFICCQMHYSHTYVLILAMTPGLDYETYCATVHSIKCFFKIYKANIYVISKFQTLLSYHSHDSNCISRTTTFSKSKLILP